MQPPLCVYGTGADGALLPGTLPHVGIGCLGVGRSGKGRRRFLLFRHVHGHLAGPVSRQVEGDKT